MLLSATLLSLGYACCYLGPLHRPRPTETILHLISSR
jgi:hypothetical protein